MPDNGTKLRIFKKKEAETYAEETDFGHFAASKQQNIYLKTAGKAAESSRVFGQGYTYYVVKTYVYSSRAAA